jgi:hypothetical protein
MTVWVSDRHLQGLGVLVPAPQRLLIIEEEALIALDIQLVIEDGVGGQATVVRDYRDAAGIGGQLSEFTLAVVTPPRTAADRAFAADLIAAGVTVVVCSAAFSDLTRTPLAGCPTVNKPFTDEELLEACRTALAAKSAS